MVPFELRILSLSVLLGFVHIVFASHSASLQRGYRWSASGRDAPVAPLTGVAGRLARALANFCETFPFFAAVVLAVVFAGFMLTIGQGLNLSTVELIYRVSFPVFVLPLSMMGWF